MKSEDILKSDLLDIIFDDRNKSYGAYELRRHYKGRLVKSLLIVFIIAGGAVVLTSFIKEKTLFATQPFEIPEPAPTTLLPVQPKEPEKPRLPEMTKPAAAAKKVTQDKFVANLVITKNESEADKLPTDLDKAAIGNTTGQGEPYKGEVFVDPPVKIDAGGKGVADVAIDRETPRVVVDEMPAFPGGTKALRKFLEKNLKSFDDIEEGKVISVKVTFVVGYDGKLKSFQVMEDGGEIYNNEVIRVLKKMPEWVPGKSAGQNVSVYYTIPVKFTSAE